MKVKFLSKQQRQSLKQAKQQNKTPQLQQKLTQNLIGNENMNSHLSQQIVNNTAINKKAFSSNSESQSEAERSREKRILKHELTKEQKEERAIVKRKYLGLEKPELNSRMRHNYKQKLLFEWEKTDDTSGGISNQMSQNSLKSWQQKQLTKNAQSLEKTWKEKSVDEMTERDWRIFREDMEIYVKGGRVAQPFRQWNELKTLSPLLINNLKKLKFQKPKAIQMQSIPIGFEQKDLVAIAPTGEGKTLGFLVPVLHYVQNLPRIRGMNSEEGPYALVLVPSRELAQQIQSEFDKISYGGITALRVIGGVQLDFQALEIQKGYDVLIGTPGRIKQLVEKHHLSLSRCSWVVIDEADKMISENLIEDIEWILESMGFDSGFTKQVHGKTRVTHMFSATMVPEIEKLTKKYLIAPTFITIGEVGGGKKDIEQHVYLINESQKNDELGKILRGLPGPIIVFVNTRIKCEKICTLIQMRFRRTCAQYHGGKSQESRQSIIQNFRNGKFQILVATDLGGRGLDIKGISAAISYDAPKNISEFIHRAGRSGRAGVKGKAFTFLTNEDEEIFYDVKNFLQRNQFKVPEQLRDHPAAQIKPGAFAQVARRKQIVYTN